MIDRINKNEERLDRISKVVKELEISLNNFKDCKKDLNYLNNYYGSPSWFKDKKLYENKKITNIKAGVLSEDAVWFLLEDIDELLNDMKLLVDNFKTEKRG